MSTEMGPYRLSASSYSNTAPLVWSFLYGSNRGKAELILDNAPARSAELLTQDRVDAALVPVIISQVLDGVRVVPGVCVGAPERVQSVCLVARSEDLGGVRKLALDVSSRTSVVLTKIIFREFVGREPEYIDAMPNIEAMLESADAALIIGDPALVLSSAVQSSGFVIFDLAALWKRYTGYGFVFAMWMTRKPNVSIDFASARDEGLLHLADIAHNYSPDLGITSADMLDYLGNSISYSVDDSMRLGMDLYFDLAFRHRFIHERRPIEFV